MSHNARWKKAHKIQKEIRELRDEATYAGDLDLRNTLKAAERLFEHPNFTDHDALNETTPTTRGV